MLSGLRHIEKLQPFPYHKYTATFGNFFVAPGADPSPPAVFYGPYLPVGGQTTQDEQRLLRDLPPQENHQL